MTNKSKFKIICTAVFISFLSSFAQAATITYIFEADLYISNSAYEDHGNLDGAHYVREITFDTNDDPSQWLNVRPGTASISYAAVSDNMTVTNRAHGSSDVFINLMPYAQGGGSLDIYDNYNQPDRAEFLDVYVPSVFFGDSRGDYRIGATTLEWSDHMNFDYTSQGNNMLPLNIDDALFPYTPLWLWSSENASAWYSTENLAVTLVPIPSAIWLLGSGLIGLVCLAIRNKT